MLPISTAAGPSAEQVAQFEDSSLRRAIDVARRMGGAGVPAWHWMSGAVGASVLASAMALSVRKDASGTEMVVAQSAAGVGCGMYLSGVRELLEEAVSGRGLRAVMLGLQVAFSFGGLAFSGPLLGAGSFPWRIAGAVVYQLSVECVASSLSANFDLNHNVSDPNHRTRLSVYLGTAFAGGCLLVASAVATGVVWRLGIFGITGAGVFAVTVGAHVLISCCGRVAYVLYAQYRAAALALAEEGLATA